MILYKHTQYGKLLIVILSIVLLSTIAAFVFQAGTNPIPWPVLCFISLIFLFALLSFYKLTIIITKNTITAKLGIGIIKKELNIKDINYASIEKIKVPALYGIGIRLTPHGWLYNVKIGHAIKIKSKTKTFFVGTEDFEKIYNILNSLKTEKL
ncbi:hypothetical protein [Pontimicrobium sp. MEBiC06410]|jgi:hypothetical protein